MSIKFIWQLPTAGDARPTSATLVKRGEREHAAGHPYDASITDPRGKRFNYFDYLLQIARAADFTHFDGVFIEHDVNGDEAWIIAGVIARATRHLRIIAEFEASRGSAVYAAKNTMSFQRYSQQRFDWAISTGGNLEQRKRQGDNLPDSEVHARISEFLTVARGVITTVPFTFKGSYFSVLNGGFQGPLAGNRAPCVYLRGDTPADIALAARQADVYIASLNEIDQLPHLLSRLREEAGTRALEIALKVDVIIAETDSEAEFNAARFWQQAAVTAAVKEDTNIQGLFVDGSARAFLVGSPDRVAGTLACLAELGINQFIFQAPASLEAVYYAGEHLLPRLRRLFAEATAHNQRLTATSVASA